MVRHDHRQQPSPPARPVSFSSLKGGMSVAQALAAFRAGCNTSADRLWVTDGWIAPYFKRLRGLLTNPITATEAQMLRAVVRKQQPLDLGMAWLAEHPRQSWREFLDLRDRKAERWRMTMRTAIDEAGADRARRIAAGPPFRKLRGGLSTRHALAAFLEGCNHKGRLFITDSWIEPRLEFLQRHLHEPITDEEAAVLRGAVLRHYSLDLVVNWLRKKRRGTWEELMARREALRAREVVARSRMRYREIQNGRWPLFFAGLDILECRLVRPPAGTDSQQAGLRAVAAATATCCSCHTPAKRLRWQFVNILPRRTGYVETTGWVVLCDDCKTYVTAHLTEAMHLLDETDPLAPDKTV